MHFVCGSLGIRMYLGLMSIPTFTSPISRYVRTYLPTVLLTGRTHRLRTSTRLAANSIRMTFCFSTAAFLLALTVDPKENLSGFSALCPDIFRHVGI
ncbi:hypothetical protein BJ166DRAFT_543273 [Pestalotiopsis sp. NC0098]|nr:hypothetical protein BJ166DRAFT_543273 [Pestalotiopsis sp. NC0098]